jgi:hypothetical protein
MVAASATEAAKTKSPMTPMGASERMAVPRIFF